LKCAKPRQDERQQGTSLRGRSPKQSGKKLRVFTNALDCFVAFAMTGLFIFSVHFLFMLSVKGEKFFAPTFVPSVEGGQTSPLHLLFRTFVSLHILVFHFQFSIEETVFVSNILQTPKAFNMDNPALRYACTGLKRNFSSPTSKSVEMLVGKSLIVLKKILPLHLRRKLNNIMS
jgi:hypothetical protein